MPKDPERGRELLDAARRVLQIEGDAIRSLSGRLNDDFEKLVTTLAALEGKVIVCGVGKSGLVGAKIAATLSSTGTPAVFLDPLDALHGGLGIVDEGDALLCLSNSGESAELINVVNAARPLGAMIIGLTGNPGSALADKSDMTVNVGVDREACPLGLAPTASTTTMLAFGDALAMTLASVKQFTEEDFAARHPGGRLGQRLKLRVRNLMRTGDAVPAVPRSATLTDALAEMTERDNLGVTFVLDDDGTLAGILTDGDLRRIMRQGTDSDMLDSKVDGLMSRGPKCIEEDAAAVDALRMMELNGITSLAIVDMDNRPAGIILLHDILGRGQFTA
jgi:arabinose-5-phosphate isomerase